MREVLDWGNRTKQAGLLDMGNKQMPTHFRRAGLVVDRITTNQKAAGSSPAERATQRRCSSQNQGRSSELRLKKDGDYLGDSQDAQEHAISRQKTPRGP